MALLRRKGRTAREPDEVISFGGTGVAVWRNEKSGDHDLKIGRAYSSKEGGTPVIGMTTSLSYVDELLETQGKVYEAFAKDMSTPEQIRPALAEFGERLRGMVAEVRQKLASPDSTTAESALAALAGSANAEVNGTSLTA